MNQTAYEESVPEFLAVGKAFRALIDALSRVAFITNFVDICNFQGAI